jgi:hypothetical protein
MPNSQFRAATRLVSAAILLLAAITASRLSAAPVLAPRSGPIDHPQAIVAGDFDRDGREDLVVADFQAGVLQLLVNQGNGRFNPIASGPILVGAATFSAPTSGPFGLQAIDFNPNDVDSDGVLNATDNCPNTPNTDQANTSTVFPGRSGDACNFGRDANGNRVIVTDKTTDPQIDTDSDGVPDFDFTSETLDNCPNLPNANQLDTDGDGVGDACAVSPDLVVLVESQSGSNSIGAVRIRMNDGSGGTVARPTYLTGTGPGQAVVTDITGDGVPDLLISDSTSNLLQYLRGSGNGNFTGQTLLHAGSEPQGLLTADVDGDGDQDLLVANRGDATIGLFMNSGGVLPSVQTATFATDARPTAFVTGKVDADAIADVIVLSQGTDARVCSGGTNQGQACLAPADCPGTGIVCAGENGSVQVFSGAPPGSPAALVPHPAIPLGDGHRPTAGLLRDLDGDGNTDLVVTDFSAGQVLLFPGNGDGTFGAFTPLVTGGQPIALTFIDLDGTAPKDDLAVVDFQDNRVDLYQHLGGFSYQKLSQPASAWVETSAMALMAADALVGFDITLLQRDTGRIDILSGVGDGSFRSAPTTVLSPKLAANAQAATFAIADLRQDGRPDIAVLDTANNITILTNELTGTLKQRATYAIPNAQAPASPLAAASTDSVADYDGDGLLNVVDDCPNVYNPALLTCPAVDACTTPPAGCSGRDPTTNQCDADCNGIGDACQVLTASPECAEIDSDLDVRADYNPLALTHTIAGALDFDNDTIANTADNCPTVSNPTQADLNNNGIGDACETLNGTQPDDPDGDGVVTWDPTGTHLPDNCPLIYNPGQEDNNNDHVGNACIIAAALDNCPAASNTSQSDADGDGIGDACATPPLDLYVPDPAAHLITVLKGDGSGGINTLLNSQITGFTTPTVVQSGHLTMACLAPLPTLCNGRTEPDLAVADRGAAGTGDDTLIVLKRDGTTLTPTAPIHVALEDSPQGFHAALLLASDQRVCPLAGTSLNPGLRFDLDGKSDQLVVVSPADSTLSPFVVSSQDTVTPGTSPLVRPPAFQAPLPVPAPLRQALFADLNQDGIQDLIAVSSAPGAAPETVVTLFFGLGNGLFFTDPTLNPQPLPFETTLAAEENINLRTDNFYPDLVLFETRDQAPFGLLNVLDERADIDGSGRVDGYDLALLAAAFGASRGEDFTLLPDATLQQTGTGAAAVVVGTGGAVPGEDLPDASGFCDAATTRLTSPRYGLPVDLNLDGIVDGKDLAFLAGLFGQTLH